MQKVIDAEKSGLFDALAHVAYALPPVTREDIRGVFEGLRGIYI
jgi:type I restriction enzyme R subunit